MIGLFCFVLAVLASFGRRRLFVGTVPASAATGAGNPVDGIKSHAILGGLHHQYARACIHRHEAAVAASTLWRPPWVQSCSKVWPARIVPPGQAASPRCTKLLCRQVKPYDPNRSTHRCCSSLKSKHRVRVSPI